MIALPSSKPREMRVWSLTTLLEESRNGLKDDHLGFVGKISPINREAGLRFGFANPQLVQKGL